MISKISKIFNSIEDNINRLRDVVMHCIDGLLEGFDLLWCDFAISGEQVSDNCMNVSRILACGPIEERPNINGVDGFNNLCDKCFLCCLTDLESVLEVAPYFSGSFDLSGSTRRHRRYEGSWIDRGYLW